MEAVCGDKIREVMKPETMESLEFKECVCYRMIEVISTRKICKSKGLTKRYSRW